MSPVRKKASRTNLHKKKERLSGAMSSTRLQNVPGFHNGRGDTGSLLESKVHGCQYGRRIRGGHFDVHICGVKATHFQFPHVCSFLCTHESHPTTASLSHNSRLHLTFPNFWSSSFMTLQLRSHIHYRIPASGHRG
jgi:hypothetical protein